MADVGAAAAQSYREHMRSKAERLGEGEDATNVDASDFTPAEKLYAGVKTGMRPVSRQARKAGGAVFAFGGHAKGTPGRAGRKSGGGLGESYVNRNQKTADEDREGHYPNGGMKRGGRAHKAVGGAGGLPAITLGGAPRPQKRLGFPGAPSRFGLKRHSTDTLHSLAETETDPTRLGHIFDEIDRRSGRARGGRLARKEGGYIPREEGPSETRALKRKTASSDVEKDGRPAAEDGRLGRASGGRAHRDAGGPLATPLAAGMGGQGRMNFNFGPQQAMSSKLGIKTGGRVGRNDGGRAKAHARYGHGPSCACPSCRPGKAGGGLGALGALGGILPMAVSELSGGDKDDKPAPYSPGSDGKAHGGRAKRADGGAIGQSSEKHPAPKGGSRAHTLKEAKERAKGGNVEKKVLAAHHAEHEAMAKGKATGGGAGRIFNDPPSYERAQARQDRAASLAQKAAFKAAGRSKAAGGRTAHAHGGKSGKGKMSVNIVIAPGGANPMGAGDPSQNPQLAIKPPMPPPAPMPMPGPGAAPGGAPMPMPIPMPGAAGPAGPPGPPGMPPRARGGRAPKGGSAGGLGRLRKIAEYGTEPPAGKTGV